MDVQVKSLVGWHEYFPSASNKLFLNWVTPAGAGNKVYRSSQPGYKGEDTKQDFTDGVIKVLTDNKIKLIVSLNHYGLADGSAGRLKSKGIVYYSLGVEDFHAPTPKQLFDGCEQIKAKIGSDSVLVYCGYGQGRTGTMMTAWQMYSTKNCTEKQKDEYIKQSTAESSQGGHSTGQKEALEKFYKDYVKGKVLMEV
ncbi:protein-tyrosine phosphatase family protein [Pseudomonas protegens]|uniref:protein-tyrosine phosphatase family protein n=1 Tax=Pseudomonas protegens TaxID=380021 RepID=UPI0009C359FC|nr:dual specificity protein phosphatase family protein [Pseudomonas protegens]AQT10323.1 hypothetical protein H78_03658 [Pseudomonas protegens]GED73327.1 hypothetical protein PFL02_01770 [Pseudomonas fluorescens]